MTSGNLNCNGHLKDKIDFAQQKLTHGLKNFERNRFVYLSIFAITVIAITGFSNHGAYASSFTAVSSGNWNDTTTWGSDSIPGSSDTVTIPSEITVTIPAEYHAIVGSAGAVSNSGTLVNSGTIDNHGIISGTGVFTSALTRIANNGTITDPVTIPNTTISTSYTLSFPVIVPSGVVLAIDSSQTLTINSSQTLTINSGGNLTIHYAYIANNGRIANNGYINNESTGLGISGITNNGTMTNNGTINNNAYITNNAGGTISNSGHIYNNLKFDTPLSGTIANNAGGTITNNSGGAIANNFRITNDGTITNNGTITNDGEIKNNGTIANNGGITNNSPGIISGHGTITSAITSITNTGTIIGHVTIPTTTISSNYTLSFNVIVQSGITLAVNSSQTLTIPSGKTLEINSSGTISNSGTITNDGVFGLHPRGTGSNSGTISTAGFFDNGGILSNTGTITNNEGGILSNSGTISNLNTITNNGTMLNICSGTIAGNPVAGNPVKTACIFTAAQSGDWNAGSTWIGGIVPGSLDDKIIPSGINVTVTSQVTNNGTITNSGTYDIANNGTIANNGAITNNLGGQIINQAGGIIINLGIITNIGTILGTGTFTSALTSLTNTGTITDPVTIPNTVLSSSYAMNYPLIVPSGVTLEVNSGQTLTISAGVILSNSGTIGNGGLISNNAGGNLTNNSSGYIHNNSGGTITNSGTIDNIGNTDNLGTINNNAGGTISNPGTMTDQCGSSFNNSGAFSGNPVINGCATISFDLSKYVIENGGYVSVNDTSASGSVSVLVNSTSDKTGFTTTLNETSPGSHVFTNMVLLNFTSNATDSHSLHLHASASDFVTAIYHNAKAQAQVITSSSQGFGGEAPPSTDIVRFVESNAYSPQQAATVKVNDPAATTSSVTVNVKSSSDTKGITLTLNADSLGAKTFTSTTTVTFVASPTASNQATGALKVTVGDTVTATYATVNQATAIIIPGTTIVLAPGYTPDTTVRAACSGDTDGDGICDNWENQATVTGIDIPSTLTGTEYKLSCNPTATYATDPLGDAVCPSSSKPDVYVQVDYMVGQTPSTTALQKVVQAFSAAPVSGGGINLHIFLTNQIPFQQYTAYSSTNSSAVTFLSLKSTYFGSPSEKTCPANIGVPGSPACIKYVDQLLTAKRQIFHYAMFMHDQAEDHQSSGYADKPGNDMIISLGEFAGHVGSVDQQAGTFMHELGHNLGLSHGGGDDINCKPNYPSVMNYAIQFDKTSGGFVTGRSLDYSRTSYSAINEAALGETTNAITSSARGLPTISTAVGGITSTSTILAPLQVTLTGGTGVKVNWNQNSNPSEVGPYKQNVHYFNIVGCTDTSVTTLNSYADWASLNFNFRGFSTFDTGAQTVSGDGSTSSEITPAASTIPQTSITPAPQSILPIVYAGPDQSIHPGDIIASLGNVTDPNSVSWNATVNYGDGSATSQLALSGTTNPAFALSHKYNALGNYTLVVSVTNDRGGTGTGNATVHVKNVVTIVANPSIVTKPSIGGNVPVPPMFSLAPLASTAGILPENIQHEVLNHDPSTPLTPEYDTTFDYPLVIDGGGYALGGYQNTIQTITEKTGTPVILKLNLPATNLVHLALYTNLGGESREITDSDTYIIYDKGQPLQKVDPHGLFLSVDFGIDTQGVNNKMQYTITFAKPMDKSDIIFRAWTDIGSSADVKLHDVLEVQASQVTSSLLPQTQDVASPSLAIVPTPSSQPVQETDLLPAIKDWGGFSSHPISDSELLSHIGLSGKTIPKWVSNAAKYVVNNDMTQQDFENLIKYLASNGIIK